MRVAVVTPVMKSGERGGAEALYAGLVAALRNTPHEVDQIEVVIDESTFDAILESYSRCYDLDLRDYDLVISTKAPTYMVRHPNHISYLFHTIRVFYDMFHREFGEGTTRLHKQRRLVQILDKRALHPDRVRKHFAIGYQPYKRLCHADPFWREIQFQVLHPPTSLEGFKEPRRGEYVFLPSRLHRWKRVDLLIRAFKDLQQDIPLKIAGTGEDEPMLRALAHGDPRIEFLGRVSDDELLDLYAEALVVPFVPLNEDYGFVTIEAFRSQKPVITCVDSGEPTYFVKNMETGFVVEPEPKAIAEKIEYLMAHPDHAAEMGRNGCAAISEIRWDELVSTLTSELVDPSRTPDENRVQIFAFGGFNQDVYRVAVLDMQPIEPPVGGGRIRLLGLYHGLGKNLPTTYVGTYDWPGEKYRRHRHSDTLEEITVPLSDEHFAVADEWKDRTGGKTIIDVSFDILARHSPRFVELAREHAASADIVIFSHPWVYPLVKDRLRQHPQLVVYDSQNVEGLLRTVLLDDGAFGSGLAKHVTRVEYELCHAADLILACSHQDRELFHELYGVPYRKILVVPNGSFTTRIAPADASTRKVMKQKLGLGDKPLALFIGSAYPPNVEAAEFIFSTLAPALPDVIFAICGGVGGALNVAHIERRANLRVTGPLSETEKLDYLAAADLAVNPMFSGSGTNIKMFDFMAAGLSIVATAVGARGISPRSEMAFQVCATEEFPHAIRSIVQDGNQARQLGRAARRLAEENHSWERIAAQLGLQLYRLRSKLDQPLPFFSVIVATYERHNLLVRLMESLRAQTFRDFEVIIVDQSRTPWGRHAQYASLDLLYLHTGVSGAVNARNRGAFHARGRVLAFTDDDWQPLPDWLENARRSFDEPGTVSTEGQILSDNPDDLYDRTAANIDFEGMGSLTTNLFLRRETFTAIDGFDERFDHPDFREDTDLGWRTSQLGEIAQAASERVLTDRNIRLRRAAVPNLTEPRIKPSIIPRRADTMWVPTWHSECGVAEYTAHLVMALPMVRVTAKPPDSQSLRLLQVQHEHSLFDDLDLTLVLGQVRADGIPVVVTEHTVRPELQAWEREADVLVALTERGVDMMRARWPSKRVHHIPLGCPTWFPPRKSKRGRTIGGFGFLEPHKGFWHLLNVLRELPDTELLLFSYAKSAEVAARWTEAVKGLPVRWVSEFLPAREIARRLAAEADILVFWYDPASHAAASYAARMGLASGVPVLTSRTGWFEDLRDVTYQPENLVVGVQHLMEDTALRARLTAAARDFCHSNTWNQSAELHLGLWRSI